MLQPWEIGKNKCPTADRICEYRELSTEKNMLKCEGTFFCNVLWEIMLLL